MNKIQFILLFLFSFNFTSIHAQIFENEDQYVEEYLIDASGRTLARIALTGYPPENYRAPEVELPESNNRDTCIIPEVPAFNWSFGCGPTSAAMIAGYYDRIGYDNMYNGHTVSGIIPMNNSLWPDIVINGENQHQCPLSATMLGLDGRTSRGHVDDFWHSYSSQIDPYFGNWEQHEYEDCTADFMGSSQYQNWNMIDGGTYVHIDFSGAPVYDYSACEPNYKDCCHGVREFFESRGYYIQPNGNFTQVVCSEQAPQGFTYEQYKAEIDAGRPVIILIMGHAMVGFGYSHYSQEMIYLHDTWDYQNHTMVWGESYSGMNHYAVIVFRLEDAPVGVQHNQLLEKELNLSNHPNPFNPNTVISFELNTEITKNAELVIYNLKGQKVKSFSPSLCHPESVEGRGENEYLIVWDGTDQTNQPVSSGVYFYKLKAGNQQITKKMLLMK